MNNLNPTSPFSPPSPVNDSKQTSPVTPPGSPSKSTVISKTASLAPAMTINPPSKTKRKTHQHQHLPNKKRKVRDYNTNEAPSSNTQGDGTNLEEVIKEHAYLRTQVFYQKAFSDFEREVESNGDLKPFTLAITEAPIQIGKGNKNFHAAHASTSAGLRCNDEENFAGTSFNIRANGATTAVPVAVNLICDKGLEKAIREFEMDLFAKLKHGKITAEDACKQYCVKIKEHFTQAIEALKVRIQEMEEYALLARKLEKTDYLLDDYDKLLNQLCEKKESLKISIAGVPSGKIKINFKFYEKLRTHRAAAKAFNTPITPYNGTPFADREKELERELAKYRDVLQYSEWELQGTQLPPFKMLVGKLDDETQTRVALTPNSTKELRKKILRNQEEDTPPPKSSSDSTTTTTTDDVKKKSHRELFPENT
jgi:hypothetical protein